MKERPILFNAPMVRAILDGSKTQTRRIVKTQPANGWDFDGVYGRITSAHSKKGKFGAFIRRGIGTDFPEADIVVCPYGQPGDRLWVREAVADIGPRLTYRADQDDGAHCKVKRWTPSIHMPRGASRIELEIVSVRVERLNAIGDNDSRAEGVRIEDRHMNGYCAGEFLPPSVRAYRELWESINGAGSWAANPWVWVVDFRRIACDGPRA